MSLIRTDMIEVRLNTGTTMTLSEFLTLSGGSLPISVFGSPTTASSVRKAVSFLESIGGGTVIAKPTPRYNRLKICVQNDNLSSHAFFNYENYRQPLNNEARPYTEDSWQIGDFIINNNPDNSNARIAGWVCREAGIPGNWEVCYRYGSSGDASDRRVISYRDRSDNFPTYGIELPPEVPDKLPLVLDVSTLSGNKEISAVISGREYDANNLSSSRDDLSDGIILIRVLEE